MDDEASKQLSDSRFKSLVGVQRTKMLAVLKTAYQRNVNAQKVDEKPN